MEENNWLKKELRRIEQVRTQANDQYNTTDKPLDKNDIDRDVYLPHKFSAKQGQTWESYIQQLEIYVKFANEKNISTHINGPRNAWYTHRSSSSCFMCEDIDLRQVMLNAMKLMAKQHPSNVF